MTNNLMGWVWLVLQANWVKKVTGKNKAYNWSIASLVMSGCAFVLGIIWAILVSVTSGGAQDVVNVVLGIILFLALVALVVVYMVAVFSLRTELQSAPFGIRLSGPMTFFFSSIYFQYHLQKWGLPGELGGLPIPYAAPLPILPIPSESSVPYETSQQQS